MNSRQLLLKVHDRFPRYQRVNQVLVQAFDILQFASLGREQAVRRVEDLEQAPQAYWPKTWDHVERNKSLFSGHFCEGSMAFNPDSRSSTVMFSARNALPNLGVMTKRIFRLTNFLSAKTFSRIWLLGRPSGNFMGRSNRLIRPTNSSISCFCKPARSADTLAAATIPKATA